MPNFSPIGVRIRVLWRILRSVRNEEEKIEEIKTKFCSFVSRKWNTIMKYNNASRHASCTATISKLINM